MRSFLTLVAVLLCVVFGGCGPSPSDVVGTNTAIAATVVAQITADAPTATKTSIPTPIPTATPEPTNTAVPTDTPQPTYTPQPTRVLQISDTWTRPADGMVMVHVSAGEFEMGSTDAEIDDAQLLCYERTFVCRRREFEPEQPAHSVVLDAFWIDRTAVTNAQYELCVSDNDCTATEYAIDPRYNSPDHPAVGVDWHNAVAYCEWADAQLPTEAEWEYAARGPQGNVYPWGADEPSCELAHYIDCWGRTVPVGSYPKGASWCGALDMAGNLWEWVSDWYEPYPPQQRVNPTGPVFGHFKVVRGGYWGSYPYELRSAVRFRVEPDSMGGNVGFRCARGSE